MISLSFQEVVRVLEARLRGPLPEGPFPAVSIDSRTVEPGHCFVALRGERFDGHDFIGEALARGATAVIHSRRPEGGGDEGTWLQVGDTRAALGVLAHRVRRRWGGPVVAISGSMGKTTTRSFAATLLGERFRVRQSRGNFNNEFGVPLSLLELEQQDELAVLELGMNHAGEIRSLARICAPDAALLTNVAEVHMEFFESLEDVAAAKAEILEHLASQGRFIFNGDDGHLVRMASRFEGETVSFGRSDSARVRIRSMGIEDVDRMRFEIDAGESRLSGGLPFAGEHLLYNVAAAVACALAHGLGEEELRRGMDRLRLPDMRGGVHRLGGGERPLTVWDDSYNSNPRAALAMLATAAAARGSRRLILVLGEMRELGNRSAHWHRRVGRQAASCSPGLLVTVGDEARPLAEAGREQGLAADRVRHFEDSESAAEFVSTVVKAGDLVLVKGSRGVRIERVTRRLLEAAT